MTFVNGWWVLSALSTLSTFFFMGWSGRPRIVLATSTILGFASANFRVFLKQQSEIERLETSLSEHEARASKLRIVADNGSRYILFPVRNIAHADFNGGHVEFHLMIENAGRRDSTVNRYEVEIIELEQIYPNLGPIEGRTIVQGRHCQHGIAPARILSETGNIRIRAENATNHGTLLFFLPGLNLEQFAAAGMQMQGDERRFGSLHCRLTLTDMTQMSATCEFQLDEA